MTIHRKPTHPGEVLREDVMVPLGLTLTETARRLGVSRGALSAVLNGKAALTPGMAVRIGKATRTTPASWPYVQAKLDLWVAEQKPAQVEEFERVAAV